MEIDWLAAELTMLEGLLAKCPVDDHLGRLSLETRLDKAQAEMKRLRELERP